MDVVVVVGVDVGGAVLVELDLDLVALLERVEGEDGVGGALRGAGLVAVVFPLAVRDHL